MYLSCNTPSQESTKVTCKLCSDSTAACMDPLFNKVMKKFVLLAKMEPSYTTSETTAQSVMDKLCCWMLEQKSTDTTVTLQLPSQSTVSSLNASDRSTRLCSRLTMMSENS